MPTEPLRFDALPPHLQDAVLAHYGEVAPDSYWYPPDPEPRVEDDRWAAKDWAAPGLRRRASCIRGE